MDKSEKWAQKIAWLIRKALLGNGVEEKDVDKYCEDISREILENYGDYGNLRGLLYQNTLEELGDGLGIPLVLLIRHIRAALGSGLLAGPALE